MGSFNSDLFFGILIGLIAYILLYIGKGIQKYAITGLQADKTIKRTIPIPNGPFFLILIPQLLTIQNFILFNILCSQILILYSPILLY